jgi:hypothetical protein
MDAKFQQLASDSQVLIVVTGDAARGRFELKLLTGSLEDAVKRVDFIGLIGVAGITPRLALAVELDEDATRTLSQVCIRLMGSAMDRVEYWISNDFKTPPANRLEAN